MTIKKRKQLRGFRFDNEAEDDPVRIEHNQQILRKFMDRYSKNERLVYHSDYHNNEWVYLVPADKYEEYLICRECNSSPDPTLPHRFLPTIRTWDVSGWDTAVILLFIGFALRRINRMLKQEPIGTYFWYNLSTSSVKNNENEHRLRVKKEL